MLTGISAPTAWPFLKRRSTSYPPVRTALGSAVDGLGTGMVQLAGVNVAAGEMVLVATANDAPLLTGPIAVDIDGNAFVQDAARSSSSLLHGTIHRYVAPAAIVGGTITAAGSLGASLWLGLVACKVAGLTGVLNEAQTNQYTSSVNPQTAATAVYPFQGFLWGLVCTNGSLVDALGTWQNSYSSGQRDGGPGGGLQIDLKEGFRITNGAPAQTKILLQTARRTVAITCNYGQ